MSVTPKSYGETESANRALISLTPPEASLENGTGISTMRLLGFAAGRRMPAQPAQIA